MFNFFNLTPRKIKKAHKVFTWFAIFSLILQLNSGVFLSRQVLAAEESPLPESTSVVELPPVEEIPVEEVQAEEPPAELPPVEEIPVEEPPVELPPVEEPPVEEIPVEEPPVEEPPAEEIPVEETTSTPEITLDLTKPIEPPQSAELVSNEIPKQIEKVCLTDEQIVSSTNEDWEINTGEGWSKTKEAVKLGVKYVYPQENKVTVTFKCLPKDGTTPLKIQKIKISDLRLPEGTNPYGEYAYDITTGMQDGSFEYDVTLPKPEGQTAEVSFMEDLNGELKTVEEGKISQGNEKVEVS